MKLILTAFLVLSSSAFAADKVGCTFDKTKDVVHLGQFHEVEGMDQSPFIMEQVAISQFEMARTILDNPDREVFLESLYEDMPEKRPDRQDFDMFGAANLIFPKGMPSRIEDLSDVQKQMLAKEGGPRILYFLGKVKTIHRTYESEAESNAIDLKARELIAKAGGPSKINLDDPAQAELKKLLTTVREKLAMRQVSPYLEKNPKKKVFIVFGRGHRFNEPVSTAVCPETEIGSKLAMMKALKLEGENQKGVNESLLKEVENLPQAKAVATDCNSSFLPLAKSVMAKDAKGNWVPDRKNPNVKKVEPNWMGYAVHFVSGKPPHKYYLYIQYEDETEKRVRSYLVQDEEKGFEHLEKCEEPQGTGKPSPGVIRKSGNGSGSGTGAGALDH